MCVSRLPTTYVMSPICIETSYISVVACISVHISIYLSDRRIETDHKSTFHMKQGSWCSLVHSFSREKSWSLQFCAIVVALSDSLKQLVARWASSRDSNSSTWRSCRFTSKFPHFVKHTARFWFQDATRHETMFSNCKTPCDSVFKFEHAVWLCFQNATRWHSNSFTI